MVHFNFGAAREYAYTSKVNDKIDVYSFGVVLLELVTGREPINGDEHINLAQWAWNHHEEGNPVVDVTDEEIKESCFLNEMSSMFKLGLICTSTIPSARPSMKEHEQLLAVDCNIGLVHHLGNVSNDILHLEVGSLIISFDMLITKSESSSMVKPLNQSIPKNVA
ncbi:hypothetical protein KY290_034012 [Solanum tuberosum]|uniref:Protein kinase domain-containing protein n=1 Tax=Solanum tuberosum TaxID=4113 RepID=A0ABQ7U323_SOLTU|nr:hypothetical protein KY289_033393 [Solanum tuberosum]KAH0648031.1 hypothetical protein KY285_033279 [Solanum tuberosum]KAH0740969.1 hypothetical protein KY290_034012 [Solanum tuberosum]